MGIGPDLRVVSQTHRNHHKVDVTVKLVEENDWDSDFEVISAQNLPDGTYDLHIRWLDDEGIKSEKTFYGLRGSSILNKVELQREMDPFSRIYVRRKD